MVGIARVLGIELPVRFHNLTVVSQHADRPAHDPVDLLKGCRTDVGFQRHDFICKRSENQIFIAGDVELSQAVAGSGEITRHASLTTPTFLLAARETLARAVVEPKLTPDAQSGRLSATRGRDL